MSQVRPATQRRVEVLELRLRLEAAAATLRERACGPSGGPRSVKARLLLLLASASDIADWASVYGLVKRAQDAYRWSSDALHGRVSMLNLPQVVIEEWREVVEEVEALVCSFPSEG